MRRVFLKTVLITMICASFAAANICASETAEISKETTAEADFIQSGIYSNEFSTQTPSGNSSVMVGTTVGIQKVSENTIRMMVSHSARTAIAETGICEAEVIGNKATFTWEDPGFLSSGDGEIVFNEDNIVLTMHTIVGARFSFPSESETLELKNDSSKAQYISEELGLTLQGAEGSENTGAPENVENPQEGMNVAVG